jgi:predicted O-methyltransferase YrrM
LERYPADDGLQLHLWPGLAVGVDEVMANFDRYGLLDDQVTFVEGWFRDTLPALKGHRWAVIRLDGDLYESTTDALENLYDGLSPGGALIVDDYEIPACRQAVNDFRQRRKIDDPITAIDWTGIWWQKSG